METMHALAIELSAAPCSVALLRDGAVRVEKKWDRERASSRLFPALSELFKESGVAPAEVDQYAVGLGPGSFAGLRMALTAARAMALPGQRALFGMGSDHALACELLRNHNGDTLAIVGDARRSRYWLGLFRRTKAGLAERVAPLELLAPAELAARLSGCSLVATPHWDKLGAELDRTVPAGAELVARACVPSADAVGRLAHRIGCRDGAQGGPLTPFYLHPPPVLRPASP